MTWELTDKARAEWEYKFDRSVIATYLRPYVVALEKRNYFAWDRLVMLMLNFGDTAFIYGLGAVLAVDPEAPEKPERDYETC